jgi:hypothetical protein
MPDLARKSLARCLPWGSQPAMLLLQRVGWLPDEQPTSWKRWLSSLDIIGEHRPSGLVADESLPKSAVSLGAGEVSRETQCTGPALSSGREGGPSPHATRRLCRRRRWPSYTVVLGLAPKAVVISVLPVTRRGSDCKSPVNPSQFGVFNLSPPGAPNPPFGLFAPIRLQRTYDPGAV